MAGHDVCTEKQAEILRKHGYDVNMTFQQASQIIERVKANGWVRPVGDPPNPFMGAGYQPGPQGPAVPQYAAPPSPGYAPAPIQQPAGNPYVQPPQGQQQQGFASQRDPNSPATEKQAAFLAQRGYTQPMTFGQASNLIDQIKGTARPPQQPAAAAYAPAPQNATPFTAPPAAPYGQQPAYQAPPTGPYAAPSPYATSPTPGLPTFG